MKFSIKIALTLVISMLLIGLLKVFVPSPVNSKERIRDFWIHKTHQKEKFNIVVAGDSRIYRGFSIDALEENLSRGLRAVNLGYSSAGFNKEYFDFIQSKLASKPAPRILLLGVSPHSLTDEAAKNEQLAGLQKLNDFQIYRALYWTPIFNFFETYQPSVILGKRKENYIQDYKSNGWVSSYKVKPDPEEAIIIYRELFEEYQVSDEVMTQFLGKVKDITDSGIVVIAFRPPSSDKMRELEDSLSGYNEDEVVKNLIEKGVIWVDFKDGNFESYDGSHLHYRSAEKLSKILAERINELNLKEAE